MNEAARVVLNHIEVEESGIDVFAGLHENFGGQQIFGGQLLAQAISVACKTISDDKKPVSIQSTFIAPGKVSEKTRYLVSRLRDGKSSSIRRVDAVQNEQTFFSATVVFHKSETGIESQYPMPKVSGPDDSADLDEMIAGYRRQYPEHLPATDIESFIPLEPFETRFPDIESSFGGSDTPEHAIWMKFNAPLSDDLSLHKQILTYASDQGISHVVSQAFGLGGMNPKFSILSLDHSVWFHREFRADQWFLMVRRCQSATASRAMVVGEMYDLQGSLIAVMTQQALYRFTG